MILKYIVKENKYQSINQILKQKFKISARLQHKLITSKQIFLNGNQADSRIAPQINNVITVNLDFNEESENIIPTPIPLNIIYEDEDVIIVNKAKGVVVHPAPGHYDDTLVNALLYHLHIDEASDIRVGIVHRLDKDTSGVMMVAKDDRILEKLSLMIKNKEVKRHYLALVDGVIGPDSGTIDAPIGRDVNYREKMSVTDINGKEAITHFQVIKRYAANTLVECVLETGRTHQIRVHMAYINHPITNDPVYNKKKATEFGQMLHSKSIEFIHPVTGEKIYYEVEPPKEFMEILNSLED